MKKILLLLILIYTSCNGPTSSTPDLSEAIIGNWWLCRTYDMENVSGNWDTTITNYTLDNKRSILSIKCDSTIDIYTRFDSVWTFISFYYELLNDSVLILIDSSGFFGSNIISMKNEILTLKYYPDVDIIVLEDYRNYSGPIPPEW